MCFLTLTSDSVNKVMILKFIVQIRRLPNIADSESQNVYIYNDLLIKTSVSC